MIKHRKWAMRLAPTAIAGAVGTLAAWSAMAADPPPPQSQPQPQAQAQTPPARPDPGQVTICRDENVTGSLVSRKRVCKTKREWDEQAEQTEQAIEQGKIVGQGDGMPR